MKRIHIARKMLEQGKPAIVIDTGKPTAEFARDAVVAGPSHIVQDRKGMPSQSGRRPEVKVWIETNADIHLDGGQRTV